MCGWDQLQLFYARMFGWPTSYVLPNVYGQRGGDDVGKDHRQYWTGLVDENAVVCKLRQHTSGAQVSEMKLAKPISGNILHTTSDLIRYGKRSIQVLGKRVYQSRRGHRA